HGLAAQQGHQNIQSLVHPVALTRYRNAHHKGIRRQGTWTNPKHDPATGDVIELIDAVGQHQGVVIGQGRHARAQREEECRVGIECGSAR
ncbi:MAG: hypothetical protein AN485_24660, partial [Anabaena sp. MDT14b]